MRFGNALGRLFHGKLFEFMNLSDRGLEYDITHHFTMYENLELLVILFLSVAISMIPIAWSLRIPVGKNLS